jgi:hypothetical protein
MSLVNSQRYVCALVLVAPIASVCVPTCAVACCRMLTYADVCAQINKQRYVCWRMLTYADVC